VGLLTAELPESFVTDYVISAKVLELCGVSTCFFGKSHELKRTIKNTIVICRDIRDEIRRVFSTRRLAHDFHDSVVLISGSHGNP